MTPYWNPKARGVIAGLSGNHSRGDVYRSILEGVALEQVMMTDSVAAATQAIDHFVVMGGGAQSDLWCQIVADAAGREVRRLETVEASSLGAAMAAAKGAGWFSPFPQLRKHVGQAIQNISPADQGTQGYGELLAIYRICGRRFRNGMQGCTPFLEILDDGLECTHPRSGQG